MCKSESVKSGTYLQQAAAVRSRLSWQEHRSGAERAGAVKWYNGMWLAVFVWSNFRSVFFCGIVILQRTTCDHLVSCNSDGGYVRFVKQTQGGLCNTECERVGWIM